jgi:hypothetical protein
LEYEKFKKMNHLGINSSTALANTAALTTYERSLRPALHVLSAVVTVAAALAGGLSLAIYFGSASLPLLPLVIVAVVGVPSGVIVFIFTTNRQKSPPLPVYPAPPPATPEPIPAHPGLSPELSIILPAPKPTPVPPPIVPSPSPKPIVPPPTLPIVPPPTPLPPRSLEDVCNDIARAAYGKPFPKYEDIEVIPIGGGPRVKWVSLPDEQKWQLFREGSKGTGGRRAVAEIQHSLDEGKPLSDLGIQAIMKGRICSEGRVSTVHGVGHAQRCAALALVLEPLYAKTFQLAPLTDEERDALQIAAMFHDSGRQGDGSDVWEEVSAQNAEAYLRQAGYSDDLCVRAGDAIRGQNPGDPLTILLREADCLEYARVRPGSGFDASHLAAFRLPLREGVSEEKRTAFLQQIVAAEQQFIGGTRDFGVDYKRYVKFAKSLFAAPPPPPAFDEKALQLVSQFAERAVGFAEKIGMPLPTEIAALRDIKTKPVDWSVAAKGCRSILQQLGQNIANESNDNAVYLGRNVESILICCRAFMDGHVSAAKLQPFASGFFSQTYTFSDGVDTKVFKPIIPTSAPSELDMERRFGISQFTYVSRETVPQALNTFLQELGAPMGIQVPDLFVKMHPGIVDGQIGSVMEKARGVRMDHVNGEHALQCNPDFRREETYLQLLDCLMGQYDRHAHNVFWDGNHIKAIDHDISFSDPNLRLLSQFRDRYGRRPVTDQMRAHARAVDLVNRVPTQFFGESRGAVDGLAGWWNGCMPRVIDEHMYWTIKAIDIDKFRRFLERAGFTPGQIDAVVNRLRSMLEHIRSGHTRVIACTAWRTDPLPECTTQNTYFMWHTRR